MVGRTERPEEQRTHPSATRPPHPRHNPGDVQPIGKGLSELRLNFGPDYRVYYLQDRDTLILLLCGGDKSTQHKDIEKAHELAEEYLVSKKKAEKEER